MVTPEMFFVCPFKLGANISPPVRSSSGRGVGLELDWSTYVMIRLTTKEVQIWINFESFR